VRANTIFVAAAALAVAIPSAGAQRVDRARVNEYGRRTADGPDVQVWIDRYSYSYGERMRAFFEADDGAYVTVLRVTSRGEVKVLYPHVPTIQRPFSSDQLVNDEIPYATDNGMYLNEPSGVGFVFAIASYTPFNYRAFSSGGRWSTLQLASNRYEDPFTIVNRFVTRTLSHAAEYNVDYIEYEVYGGYNRSTRPYANSATYSGLSYGDLYFQCLQYYGPQAASYCTSYAQFGGAPPYGYGYGVGSGVFPAPVPTGGKNPVSPKMHPPKNYVPDPVIVGGLEPKAPQPDPTGTVDVFRSTPREGGKAEGREAARRAEPADRTPAEYRVVTPMREPQYQPAPQRYEPPPQQRAEPAPVGAMPRYEAPVVRSEPRVMPSPPPAPPPSPPPAPASAPASEHPVVPPSAPPAGGKQQQT